jgi:hypothetical protein
MAVLDQDLLKKLEKKTGLSKKSLRETISHRASKQSISPQTCPFQKLVRRDSFAFCGLIRYVAGHDAMVRNRLCDTEKLRSNAP